ncbi:tagaturonate reductase [Arachidicoccus rhizosphaerae]|uniref:Tagaturonate reductase n=1 Tax=Arachidicoccus rhizosphaerae TaxID=551991 RepID=A0A1H4AQR8_9BACT|nr:tagaturonate reductase [Arachidicoccus rhizosphaerae]SEA38259.1 tagaturonate reductase [Arachidicoccus rhizosphaerae]
MQEILGNKAVNSRLNRDSLAAIKSIPTPGEKILALPEKVLQFGTGVLLRGLPDYYIDQANKQGVFNGRILVVKSTAQNKADDFKEQDGLFTLCLRGWSKGKATSEDIINGAISRVLDSQRDWQRVLEAAASPDMQIVFSNTTEVGIVLDKEDILVKGQTPRSFPGKLLAFLLERFEKFKGDPDGSKGMVIVPTELITDNGSTLKKICLELARINQLSEAFIQWLDQANDFCDSLVDRIVSGRMQPKQEAEEMGRLGYTDKLMIMSEVYGLWAIQTSRPHSAAQLSFSQVNKGVIVTADIEKYRHLKLFLLNAPHTFSCVIAQALGFQFVNQAMNDEGFYGFISELLMEEAVPAVLGDTISKQEATDFAQQVLDRFKNPYIDHRWSDISKQMTLKMGMRCLPLMRDFFEKFGKLPERMVKGFAAYLAFLKNQFSDHGSDNNRQTTLNGAKFSLTDAKAAALAAHWDKLRDGAPLDAVIADILLDESIWPQAVLEAVRQMDGLAVSAATALQAADFGNNIRL